MSRFLVNTRQFLRASGWVFGPVPGGSVPGLLAFLVAVFPAVVPLALADDADHLILSEFMVKTRNPVSTFGSPFIEVTNPTGDDIDLSQVYITDGNYSPNALYYLITRGDAATDNPGGGLGGDFHARFPDGLVLGAGQSLVISLNGSGEFFEAYGRQPDFELFEDGSLPDAVPELVEAFPGSINAGPLGGGNVPALSDVAESIMLYTWDGQSDLVQDLDYVTWGANESVRVDKTGVTVGSHTYRADTPVGDQDPAAGSGPAFGHALQRVSSDEGSETTTGGNGIGDPETGGHDETSENLSVTWADVSPADPAAGMGGTFPSAPIFTGLQAGDATAGSDFLLTATILTFGTMDHVDFFYSVDGGTYSQAAGTAGDDNVWTATVPAQAEGAVVSFYCVAVNADGGQTLHPAAAPFFPALTVTVEAAPEPGTQPEKLLITEVSTGENIYPFTGMAQLAMEFIEIHNPNDHAVDMSDYYITDAINYNFGTQLYWFIAQGDPSQSTIGGGHYNDFVARFPDDYMIPAHGTITISMAGSSWFEAYFGISPDLEMYEEGPEPDDIPDMRPVFENPPGDLPGNSIYTPDRPTNSGDHLPKGIPELEEHYGEPLILYHWIEGEDLVTDIDIFMWGDAKTGDYRYGFDKTGQTVGGSTYQDDTPVLDQDWYMPLDETGTVSYTRIDADEGTQSQGVGNGVDGRDETSENWSETFATLGFTPGFFLAGGSGEVSPIQLVVPARTFNPSLGERFPIQVVSKTDSETRLRIFDMEGRLVITLYDSRFDGDASTFPDFPTRVVWDGRSDTYDRVRAGMYVIHLSVVNKNTGEEENKTAPVVVATRLSK